ncbi:MAG: hypothetical protein MJ209_00130 [archaeon]|nr:hypothetical protein [archaeon]
MILSVATHAPRANYINTFLNYHLKEFYKLSTSYILVLNIYENEYDNFVIPEHPNLIVNLCPINLRVHNKHYWVGRKYKDDVIITLDDDTYYNASYIQALYDYCIKENTVVSNNCYSLYNIRKDRYSFHDEHNFIKSHNNFAIGFNAVAYPKGFLNKISIIDCINYLYDDDLLLKLKEIEYDYKVLNIGYKNHIKRHPNYFALQYSANAIKQTNYNKTYLNNAYSILKTLNNI